MLVKSVETTQLGVTITDTTGKIIYTNPADAAMHGFTVDELLGQDVRIFATRKSWKPMTREQFREVKSWKREGMNLRKDGSVFPVLLLSDVVVNSDGEPIAMITTCQDISERRQAEEELAGKSKELMAAKELLSTTNDELEIRVTQRTLELRNANQELKQEIAERVRAQEAQREIQERYELAANGANDGLWDWNLKTNLVYYSIRWKSMLGYPEQTHLNSIQEWLNRLHPDDRARVDREIERHLHGSDPHFESEYRILHHDGSYRWMLSRGLVVRDATGSPHRMAGSQSDITKRKQAEEQLLREALHDSLTGLPNRTLFMDRLDHCIRRHVSRETSLFAVLFVDLDRFKNVNDSLGHTIGDTLLVEIASRLSKNLRAGDTVARLGGDEFAILMDGIGSCVEVTCAAERLLRVITAPCFLDGHEIYVTASIGITLSTMGYDPPEHLLRDADTAMYRAKMLGKARYELFNKEMYEAAVAVLRLENDLTRAVEREEFELHYQPIVSLTDGSISAFEALVRWRHPERGLISPAEFIPLAEETGIIIRIGEWVLRRACRQLKDWRQKFPGKNVNLSVNLSAKQFAEPSLIPLVDEILGETQIDPATLAIEITESAIMKADVAKPKISDLKSRRIQVHIDDFGTGYSSLSYLHRFAIDCLKIDRSFVALADQSAEDAEIVKTIVALARNLKMQVVAEGVETSGQAEQLSLLGCSLAQGYLFSRPLTSEAAEQLLVEDTVSSNFNLKIGSRAGSDMDLTAS